MIFLLVNCYWFCYEAFHGWGGVRLAFIDKNSDELPAHHGLVLIHPLDKTLLCGISCTLMSWDERREGRENHVGKDLDGTFLWLCLFLSQLVATGIAHLVRLVQLRSIYLRFPLAISVC